MSVANTQLSLPYFVYCVAIFGARSCIILATDSVVKEQDRRPIHPDYRVSLLRLARYDIIRTLIFHDQNSYHTSHCFVLRSYAFTLNSVGKDLIVPAGG